MSVTAAFDPGRVSSEPGGTAALTLHLSNDAEAEEVVRLRAIGELAKQTVLQSETIYLDPSETFDVPVIVDVNSALSAGPHNATIEVVGADGTPALAEATIDVQEATGYVVTMSPEHSRSATAGRHKVLVQNTGNTPIVVELLAETAAEGAAVELAAEAVNVAPGDRARIDARVIPPDRFWNGPAVARDFTIRATGSDGVVHELPGTFEQGPRVRPWLVPALVGALIALVLFLLIWFTLLRPWVERTADDAAEQAIFDDRAALRERIEELEAAAAEAEELPLGEPADLRLAASAAPGASGSETFAVGADRVLSVTDVVFQNPSGAVGRVSLLRDDVVLLESELANFRDLDFHFVAPFHFDGSTTVELQVDCTAPGPNEAECSVAATIIGFVDEQR